MIIYLDVNCQGTGMRGLADLLSLGRMLIQAVSTGAVPGFTGNKPEVLVAGLVKTVQVWFMV